jgi:hypothetical protein
LPSVVFNFCGVSPALYLCISGIIARICVRSPSYLLDIAGASSVLTCILTFQFYFHSLE